MNNSINLSRDDADKIGYAIFNNCRHLCVNFDEERGDKNMLTVSVKLPDGRHVTMCVIGNGDGSTECADVQLHGSPEPFEHLRNDKGQSLGDGMKRLVQRAIMFGPGYGDNRLRRVSKFSSHLYGTLLTLLINPKHYNLPEFNE